MHAPLVTVPIALVAALAVRIARSGLGQTATNETGAGDDGDVEPPWRVMNIGRVEDRPDKNSLPTTQPTPWRRADSTVERISDQP
jgi:hypothetical protein